MTEERSVSTGLTSALLACSGGAILLVQTAQTAGLAHEELVTWFGSVYVIGGLLNLILSLTYRIPFAGAHSITAVAFIGTLSARFTWPELAGGFIMSGVLILIAGSTGLFGAVLNRIPKPLIDALLAGLLLSYVIDIVPAAVQLPVIGLLAGAGYFLVPRVTKSLSPALWALLLGLAGLALLGGLHSGFPPMQDTSFAMPHWVHPVFTVSGMFAVALPLSLLIMSNDLAVALVSLRRNGYGPSVGRTMTASGFASVAAGLFGGHAANVGGMMSALCSSPEAGPSESRYRAAVVSNAVVILFGLAAWQVTDLIRMLPASFVAMMTGFSLLGLFQHAVRSALQNRKLLLSVLLTFGAAALHLHAWGISTPIWALLIGAAVLKLSAVHERRKRKLNPLIVPASDEPNQGGKY
ncbi:benzoate/H(+) symporter BenE family transporter [Paenibacillus sp. R14(2021)]|uniref:benzoate/H(+) symporter BenE family transporter n=1 Tax=Paenibacillus sp. R14(2021) TaxID=2859228 RepID=UPI001C613693|nr:benzoate/H(+) symporter BenE family transporter [Paenibacillus sp. R14(2021)]